MDDSGHGSTGGKKKKKGKKKEGEEEEEEEGEGEMEVGVEASTLQQQKGQWKIIFIDCYCKTHGLVSGSGMLWAQKSLISEFQIFKEFTNKFTPHFSTGMSEDEFSRSVSEMSISQVSSI